MDKASSRTKTPRSAPRRNIDARREQNRIASRNYREKRKQKLALLNQIIDNENASSASSSSHPEDENADADLNHKIPANPNDISPPLLLEPQNNVELGLDLANIDEYIIPSNTSASHPHNLMPSSWTTFLPSTGPTTASGFSYPLQGIFTNSALLTDNNNAPPSLPPAGPSSSPAQDEAIRNVLKGIEHFSISQKRSLIRLLQNQVEPAPTPTPLPRFNSEYPASNNNNNNNNNTPKLCNRTRLQLEALEFSISLHLAATAGPSSGLSECMRTNGLFSALFANCFALGMPDVGPLLIDDGWSIFGLGPEIAYHPSQLSVIRGKYRHLAPAMQPCDKQLTVAHHPYIDVIPFKRFREKLLEALDHDPPLLDEDVLCHDMLGGLICWGSRQNNMGMDAAVPWDVRSWEPSIWFLSKYRGFVGGWDDEMWKGARLWHSMRGQRIQVASAAVPW